MQITISAIKADTGSIGGHEKPSEAMLEVARNQMQTAQQKRLLIDFKVSYTGDDIALLMSHSRGVNNPDIHELAWNTFMATTAVAKKQGLYGAGQDLLKNSFSGNVRGMGPGAAEIEFDERPAEPILFFAADKTSPGVFNYPLFSGFADPFHNAGLLLSAEMQKGFAFTIMDVNYTEADKIITLQAPEDYYDIATLLRDPERYVVESIAARASGMQAAVVSTSRLHNIAGKYTGKDDPVALVRAQKQFPSTGEILSPYALAHYILGDNRGSHHVAVMPVKQNSTISYFDGPTIMSAIGLCVHKGKFTEIVDLFAHPFWDWVRNRAAEKTYEMRQQGFFNPAMGPMAELEYTGVMENLARLENKFTIRRGSKKDNADSDKVKVQVTD